MCNKGGEIYDGRLTDGGIIMMICHVGICDRKQTGGLRLRKTSGHLQEFIEIKK